MSATLSARLRAVLDGLLPCEVVIDVGTDHGLLPIAAVTAGVAQRAIAADLRPLPLAGARRAIAAAGVADRVTPLLSDGLAAVSAEQPGTPDALTMAGMSGDTMARICDARPAVVAALAQIVVQPNSGVDVFRRWASSHGWHLRSEAVIAEKGRYFQVLAFLPRPAEDPAYRHPRFTAEELFVLGPLLLAGASATTTAYFGAQVARVGALIDAGVPGFTDEYALWRRALYSTTNAVVDPYFCEK